MNISSDSTADLGGFFNRNRAAADSSVRVGDAERQQTVDTLAKAHGLGQLDLSEFDERSSKAWSAKTVADLAGLTVDLPAQIPERTGKRTAGSRRGLPAGLATLGYIRVILGVLVTLMVVSFVLGHLLFILPWVVLFMFVTGRIGGRGRAATYGPRFNQRRW